MRHSQAVIKVTFVGAGSIEFTRNVVTDLCGYPEFHGRLHLSLYDISTERLAHAERLARRIAAQTGCDAEVTATADRRAALAGADYVINEVQVGGYAATRADFDIPARYGVRQTIGDTLGIGGIFRGLRTIPVVVALAQDMQQVCPDAYLLSYSNPMAMLPWAVYAGTEFRRVYGLCHSVRDTQAFLTNLVGADPDRVRFLTAGFNHQAFVLRFEQNGQSLYPRLAEIVAGSAQLQRRVRVEIFRRFGYFPTESSEHSAEYVFMITVNLCRWLTRIDHDHGPRRREEPSCAWPRSPGPAGWPGSRRSPWPRRCCRWPLARPPRHPRPPGPRAAPSVRRRASRYRRPGTGARCGSPGRSGTARRSPRPGWPGIRPGCHAGCTCSASRSPTPGTAARATGGTV
jgi:alpha-galactosidase/6-phospho-beta-glucosidase family protein